MSIFLINPFVVRPIVREYFASAYNSTRTTTANTAYQNRTTLSTTETAGDYVAFWMANSDHSVTTSDTRARLFETSSRQFSNIEPQDVLDRMSTGGMYPYAGGTNKTFTIEYSAEAGTAGINGTEIDILKLVEKDLWSYNLGTTTATANAVSVTITDPGDYLVIGSGMLGANDNAVIFDGTNSYGPVDSSMSQDNTTFSPFWHIRRFTGLTNETLSVRVTTGAIRESSILALKLDKFANVYYAEQPTQQSTTATAVSDALSQAFTIANPSNRHLILGCGQLNVNSTANLGNCYLRNTTTSTIYNTTHTRENNATNEYYPTIVSRIVTFPAASNTLAWSFFTTTAGTATRLRNMAIAVLDLGIT